MDTRGTPQVGSRRIFKCHQFDNFLGCRFDNFLHEIWRMLGSGLTTFRNECELPHQVEHDLVYQSLARGSSWPMTWTQFTTLRDIFQMVAAGEQYSTGDMPHENVRYGEFDRRQSRYDADV